MLSYLEEYFWADLLIMFGILGAPPPPIINKIIYYMKNKLYKNKYFPINNRYLFKKYKFEILKMFQYIYLHWLVTHSSYIKT